MSHRCFVIGPAHSSGAGCCRPSINESCISSIDGGSFCSDEVIWDIDSTSATTTKGALWGSGDRSMGSFIGPGEEEGRGGVVTHSVLR